MRPVISALANYVAERSAIFLPVALFVLSTLGESATPIPHSLFISFVSWAIIWVYNCLRFGFFSGHHNVTRTKLSWLAGALFALAQLCQRAAYDREGIWQFMAFLPAVVNLCLETEPSSILLHLNSFESHATKEKPTHQGSRLGLFMVTALASTALSTSFITDHGAALGICGAIFLAIGLIMLEKAIESTKDEKQNGRGFMMANGTFSRRVSGASSHVERSGTVLRDIAAAVAVLSAVASFLFESFRTDPLTFNRQVERFGGNWTVVQNGFLRVQILVMIIASALENALLFLTTRRSGSSATSFVLLAGCLASRLALHFSLWSTWFTICSGLAITVHLYDSDPSGSSAVVTRLRRRFRQLIAFLGFVSALLLIAYHAHHFSLGRNHQFGSLYAFDEPEFPLGPKQFASANAHPVHQLIHMADTEFQNLLEGQSKSLGEAVEKYRQKYGIHPPPNFDRWYEFAKRREVVLIDEFDTIHQSMVPFWGLEPATIRARAREALGNDDNFLLGLLIRDGAIVKVERGEEWQQQATVGMIENFVQHLPDMDLPFNIHDEPRVIVPHDRLSRMVSLAQDVRIPKALANKSPRNAFSPRPEDLGPGKRIEPVPYSRFNRFAHQATWTHSRMSCSPESPAQTYEETDADNLTSYAIGELGFVYNVTAFADICMLPSLRRSHAFFDCPNAYNLATELFPVFSQSKISSYQDILYPSPWYWSHKVNFEKDKDVSWDEKINAMYWRGSTTGGYSRFGGWRRHHRQHVVRKMNGLDKAMILSNTGDEVSPLWEEKTIKRSDFKELVDIHFSHVGQCDPADCDAQIEFFDVVERVDPQEAWKWKHLLDIDGNAFSGRFYAFLESTSLTYKMSIFQEWHRDWIKPWIHYIPLSLRGDEWLEILRYFSTEKEGQEQAPRMATQGREWASKALRNEDFEVWFFRLLLEYGRVIDDNRENIGYPGP